MNVRTHGGRRPTLRAARRAISVLATGVLTEAAFILALMSFCAIVIVIVFLAGG